MYETKQDHNSSNFLKAVFHKFYLVHSRAHCPICLALLNTSLLINTLNIFTTLFLCCYCQLGRCIYLLGFAYIEIISYYCLYASRTLNWQEFQFVAVKIMVQNAVFLRTSQIAIFSLKQIKHLRNLGIHRTVALQRFFLLLFQQIC